MNRRVTRNYSFDVREVREALIGLLHAKDLPAPAHVVNNAQTGWTYADNGDIHVEWSEIDDVDLI